MQICWSHSHPLTETDHRPHGAAQGAAAAETAEQQPAHIDWQSFPQGHVDPRYGGLEGDYSVSPLPLR